MKDIRKYLSCLLIVMSLVCIMQVHTASAAASLSASADAAGVAEGDYVDVSINLNDNPSISTLGAVLSYDSNILSYDGASWSDGFSESDMKMASDTGSEVNLSAVCDGSYSVDGTVVTVRFQAVSDSSSIPVTLSLRDMADADLDAVTNCHVSSRVRVPETAGGEDNAAEKEDGAADLKSQETENTDETEEKSDLSEPKTADISSADTGNVQSASDAVAVNARETGTAVGSGMQYAQTALASSAGNAKPDQNYKTGAGLGNDIFLIIATACGILALILSVRKHGEEMK